VLPDNSTGICSGVLGEIDEAITTLRVVDMTLAPCPSAWSHDLGTADIFDIVNMRKVLHLGLKPSLSNHNLRPRPRDEDLRDTARDVRH